jgi:sarcosine/dimethylglycine N-methyltransferase
VESGRTTASNGGSLLYLTQSTLTHSLSTTIAGTSNIHFGKWDGIDLEEEGAYGKASDAMTDYMLKLAMELLGNPASVQYVDLGSGAGGAAVRLLSRHPEIAKATCVNLCAEQNAGALASATTAAVQDRIAVVTNTYDETPFGENTFDFSFSQDAYVHSFSKVKSYGEAFRVTKKGGVFVFCDLMAGTGPDVTAEEYETFSQTNMVNDFLNPADNVKACEAAGWTEVKFVDLTVDIKISFQLYVHFCRRYCYCVIGRLVTT